METVYLNPSGKLVDETADWLCGTSGRVHVTREGAASLDHVMVVLPTAQSGRSLRLAVARRFEGRGVIPPRTAFPAELVVPRKQTLREAGETEIAAAFQQYAKSNAQTMLSLDRLVRKEEFDDLTARFALLDQLEDIWRILAGRGLLMQDVPELGKEVFAEDIGDEMERWEQLALLEKSFFGYLETLGLAYPTKLIHDAKGEAAIVPDEVEEIVLPALADPIRVLEDVLRQQIAAGKKVTVLLHADPADGAMFDEWGRPRTERWTGDRRPVLSRLSDADIVLSANSTSLARTVADDMARGDACLPELALCDGSLYDCVAGAFLARGYVVHNPERHLLAQSSLGRMIRGLISVYGRDVLPWKEFAQLFRSDDVLNALGLSGGDRARALEGLDIAQNAYVPTNVPPGFVFPPDAEMRRRDREKFDFFCEQGRELERALSEAENAGSGLPGFIRRMLKKVFARRRLSGGAGEKEFTAAAGAAREFLNALEGEVVRSLPADGREMRALALRGLDAACYSLEPDSPDAVKTAGWLELAWSPADGVALAGFHEGCVPDSVVGHPFLPDRLRKGLGLVSNDDRLARDTWLLHELLASHARSTVRVYVARTDDDGDICRPSRLLYLCADDELPARVEHLFGDVREERGGGVKMVDWFPRLPDRVEPPAHFSPSAIDAYVNCPFTYLLKYGLGMKPYREKRELEANDFGTLAHAALRMYAESQIAMGDGQLTEAGDIRRLFAEEIFPCIRRKYAGAALNVDLQLRSLEGRLLLFADVQASWAAQGWRIRMTEREIAPSLDVPGLNFRARGFIDRVDENISPGCEKPWCVIDYKTWDRKSDVTGHVYTSSANTDKNRKQLEFARRFGYPLVGDKRRMLSVQLPVYGKCLAASEPRAPFAAQKFQYLILGKNAGETGLVELKDEEADASLATARIAADCIRANVFWPPGPAEDWKRDFGGLFVSGPEEDIGGSEWAAAHCAKTEDGRD